MDLFLTVLSWTPIPFGGLGLAVSAFSTGWVLVTKCTTILAATWYIASTLISMYYKAISVYADIRKKGLGTYLKKITFPRWGGESIIDIIKEYQARLRDKLGIVATAGGGYRKMSKKNRNRRNKRHSRKNRSNKRKRNRTKRRNNRRRHKTRRN